MRGWRWRVELGGPLLTPRFRALQRRHPGVVWVLGHAAASPPEPNSAVRRRITAEARFRPSDHIAVVLVAVSGQERRGSFPSPHDASWSSMRLRRQWDGPPDARFAMSSRLHALGAHAAAVPDIRSAARFAASRVAVGVFPRRQRAGPETWARSCPSDPLVCRMSRRVDNTGSGLFGRCGLRRPLSGWSDEWVGRGAIALDTDLDHCVDLRFAALCFCVGDLA